MWKELQTSSGLEEAWKGWFFWKYVADNRLMPTIQCSSPIYLLQHHRRCIILSPSTLDLVRLHRLVKSLPCPHLTVWHLTLPVRILVKDITLLTVISLKLPTMQLFLRLAIGVLEDTLRLWTLSLHPRKEALNTLVTSSRKSNVIKSTQLTIMVFSRALHFLIFCHGWATWSLDWHSRWYLQTNV